ncbi:MAG TPA: serine hydrolase domain-containing protein [Spirochaetota bacterium]|nr:serine hydrolase domain-containing protein [Spirochaetota bacterium]HPG51295.1 serine hydrolase domain-containing protein [Spirochaetota bacterium]HPN10452.1 serine hydrolase domain-containing protein [Spirochaetota bacterium]
MNHDIQNRDVRIRDFIAKRLASNDFPGLQYIVVSPESILFNYSGGLADIKGNRPVEPETTMMIYSMTKTFTAAAVIQLADNKKLSLDDPVSNYIPDIPYSEKITIRQLLSQTSGIPDPIPLRWVHLAGEDPSFDEDLALNNILAENPKLDFYPGKKYAYSNISYWLLGKIIEKAGGTGFKAYMRDNIFRRLGLSPQEIDCRIPSGSNHAKGYLKKYSFLNLFKSLVMDAKYFGDYEGGWLRIRDHYLNGPSFGGMVSSARSIGVFLQDQLQEESVLFSKEGRRLFYEQQRNNDGDLIGMSPGWHIKSTGKTTYYYKEGGGGGFHCEMRIYPSRKIASVVIANNTSFDAPGFLDDTDREFFELRDEPQ